MTACVREQQPAPAPATSDSSLLAFESGSVDSVGAVPFQLTEQASAAVESALSELESGS